MDKLNSKYLITTGLKISWPKSNNQKTYLGSWCFNSLLEENDKIVFNHPWDNRELYFEDYKYIKQLNEIIINNFTTIFNDLNKVNKSKKFWRILLSPWILSYITICLSHWRLIHSIYEKPDKYKTIICQINQNNMVLNDMQELKKLYLSNEWNHFTFYKIINFFNNNTNNKKILPEYSKFKINFDQIDIFNVKRFGKLLINNFFYKSYKSKEEIDHFFYNSYINNFFSKDLKKKIVNSEFKNLNYDIKNVKKFKYNNKLRNKIKINIKATNNFEKFLFTTLNKQLPKIYVEGFDYLIKKSKKIFPLTVKKTITTAVDHYSDDIFKYWIAEQNQSGAKIFINQHGGSFGMLKWYQFEDHSIKISDKFLTWGWSREEKCYPLSASKLFDNRALNLKKNGGVLLVYFGINKFPINHDAVPLFTNLQRNSYENDQIYLFKNLNNLVKKNFKIRLYPNTYAPNDLKLIQKNFSNAHIDKNKNFYKSLERSKIFIGTYNSTTYLESIFYNFPTIIYWNEKHWELHNSAKDDFEMLKSLNIFHNSPKSLANFLNKIWPDVSKWWHSKEVQDSINKFRAKYIMSNRISTNKWVDFYNKN